MIQAMTASLTGSVPPTSPVGTFSLEHEEPSGAVFNATWSVPGLAAVLGAGHSGGQRQP